MSEPTIPGPDERTAALARAWVRAALSDVTLVLSTEAALYLATVSMDDWAAAVEAAAVEAGRATAYELRCAVVVHIGGGIVTGLGPDGQMISMRVEGLGDAAA